MVRLSISELEETVSIMVKSSQGISNKVEKPTWWPVDYQFPLKRHPGVDKGNWRAILHNLISKCYQFNNCKRQRSKKRMLPKRKHEKKQRFRRNSDESASGSSTSSTNGRVTKNRILEHHKSNNIVLLQNGARIRRHSADSSVGSMVSSLLGVTPKLKIEGAAVKTSQTTGMCSGLVRHNSGDSSTSLSESSVAEVLANNLGLSQKLPNRIISPIVSVYDVCKVKPSIIGLDNNNIKYRINENCDVTKRDKNNFMNYFDLDSNKKQSDSISMLPANDKSQISPKLISNRNNLLNCPHVPFSSNLGLKLIKGWHNFENEVIEKRLERLERYLCNNNLPSLLTPIKEEFKVLNNKNSDSRAKLDHFYIFPTKKRHRKGKLTPKARFLLKEYCKPCFVNLSNSGPDKIKTYLDKKNPKVIAIIDLTNIEDNDKQKENKTPFPLLESRVVLTAIDKFKENLSSVVKKSTRPNFALQTLVPRNENLVESTIALKNSVRPQTKTVNFINPSVVLHPIHELFEFSKRDKILNSTRNRTPYKVVKNRVNVYNPRRFSTRQQDVDV